MKKDLTEDRPRYILSAYAPEKDLPIQLFGGYPREQSFEELRLRHYELAFQGNQQQAIQEAQTWFTSAEQQIQTALNDIEGAIKYMINGENEHPNRIDICRGKGASATQNQSQGGYQQTSSAFGQPSSTSGFGQPSSLGQPSSAFGQQQSATGQTSLFGQPTQAGRPSTSFGQLTSTFGQPTSLAPSFAQPSNPISAFGQPTTPAPALGQPSAPPAFGQASSLGQQHAPASTLGALGSTQQAQSGFSQANNVFGRPSAPAPSNAFSQVPTGSTNAFGQQPTQTTSGFGQPTLAVSNPFKKPVAASAPNTFGQTSTASSNLSQPPTQPPNVFGQPSNPFGKAPTDSSRAPLGTVADTQPRPQSQQVHATYAGDRLKTWKGKPVFYEDNVPYIRAQDGELEKIHFPNGPPSLTKSPELPDELYDEGTKEIYKFMSSHGAFKDGIMPNLPPKRAWCKWDF